MANVYIVIEQGVYRHRIWPFSTQGLAETFAEQQCAAGDGYHSYDVVEMTLDDGVTVPDHTQPEGQRTICHFLKSGLGKSSRVHREPA